MASSRNQKHYRNRTREPRVGDQVWLSKHAQKAFQEAGIMMKPGLETLAGSDESGIVLYIDNLARKNLVHVEWSSHWYKGAIPASALIVN